MPNQAVARILLNSADYSSMCYLEEFYLKIELQVSNIFCNNNLESLGVENKNKCIMKLWSSKGNSEYIFKS